VLPDSIWLALVAVLVVAGEIVLPIGRPLGMPQLPLPIPPGKRLLVVVDICLLTCAMLVVALAPPRLPVTAELLATAGLAVSPLLVNLLVSPLPARPRPLPLLRRSPAAEVVASGCRAGSSSKAKCVHEWIRIFSSFYL
jgi:hypothetical protein